MPTVNLSATDPAVMGIYLVLIVAWESAGLAGTPWHQNYRILPLILLAFTAAFIIVWQ